jgi:DNA-binding transcriptional ArsR family regulator
MILLTNHNHLAMVLTVTPSNANYGTNSGTSQGANHVFRALADPTRRAIFEELTRQGEQTVHALTRYAGVSQPAVSKHLTVLKRAKLVRHRRDGRETHYRAQPDALAPMVNWLDQYGAFWRDRFDRLEELLERMEP